jgi:hypothetical protein
VQAGSQCRLTSSVPFFSYFAGDKSNFWLDGRFPGSLKPVIAGNVVGSVVGEIGSSVVDQTSDKNKEDEKKKP